MDGIVWMFPVPGKSLETLHEQFPTLRITALNLKFKIDCGELLIFPLALPLGQKLSTICHFLGAMLSVKVVPLGSSRRVKKSSACTRHTAGGETANRADYYLSGGLNSFPAVYNILAGKNIFNSGFLLNVFLLAKNCCINIHNISLGQKSLVYYLYLICLWEIQYLWCCATGLGWNSDIREVMWTDRLIVVRIVWYKSCSDYCYRKKNKLKKRTDTPSLRCCAVCHRPLAACPTSITHLSGSLTSQTGFDTPGDDKFNKEHKLVRVLHASRWNYLPRNEIQTWSHARSTSCNTEEQQFAHARKKSHARNPVHWRTCAHTGLSLEMTTACCFTFPGPILKAPSSLHLKTPSG